jgi:hypothetical protein
MVGGRWMGNGIEEEDDACFVRWTGVFVKI